MNTNTMKLYSELRSQMNLITWCWVVIVFVMFVAMGIVAYMNICH